MDIDTLTLKKELADALNQHIGLLSDVEYIDHDHQEAFIFMMRRFGFMLNGAPNVLLSDDDEELYFAMFQYYSLLTELKCAVQMHHSYAEINGRKLTELLDKFPHGYEKEMQIWWETKTGLAVGSAKQTLDLKH